jgi:hypothetical protein
LRCSAGGSGVAARGATGPWKDLWNGDLSLTDKIIAEDFTAHAAPITGTGTRRDPRPRRGQRLGQRHPRHPPDLTFTIDVGPVTDEEHLVVRWKAHGTYGGGFPGAAPTPSAATSPSPAPTPAQRRRQARRIPG